MHVDFASRDQKYQMYFAPVSDKQCYGGNDSSIVLQCEDSIGEFFNCLLMCCTIV